MTTTNGTTEPKEPSRLETLHQEYIAAGGKPPAPKAGYALVSVWAKAVKAQEAAEAALSHAQKVTSDAAADVIRAFGRKKRIPWDGENFQPSSRGTTVFLRREGGGEIADLGR